MNKNHVIDHFTVYLGTSKVCKHQDFVRKGSFTKHEILELPEFGESHLFIKPGVRDYPKWISLLDEYLEPDIVGKTNGVSAVLILATSRRFFALSFGQGGRFLLNDSFIETRFGLFVTLNSININSFRCVDKQSLDNLESQSRVQSSYETTPDRFGINVEQDILKAVVGTPNDNKYGARMTGTDALSVSLKVTINTLKPLLDSYLIKYGIDLSIRGYEWVKNISSIKTSSPVIPDLEKELNRKLLKKDFKNMWLSVPDIISWDTVKGFIYTHGKNIIHPDITMKGFLTTVTDGNICLDLLKRRSVYCANENHEKIDRSWKIYKCLYAELDYNDLKYILNGGTWYQIEPNFVKKTDKLFSEIPVSDLILPAYKHKNETSYNEELAKSKPTQYVLLDDKNKIFHGGGQGQVEVCDIFTSDKNLIHIKRYGKSSVLSHLIAQGFVSGHLLKMDPEFRDKLNKKLPNKLKSLISKDIAPKDNEYKITFAIISKKPGKKLLLPFFTRVNLNNTKRILNAYGFTVELLKIDVDPLFAKTKRCPPA